jgi:hypothetical protein
MGIFQRVVFRSVAPARHAQAPTLRQVLTGRSDPRVNQRVANQLWDRVKPPLLRRLVRMIEIKLVDEFIECHREIGGVLAGNASDLGKILRASHIVSLMFVVVYA